MLAHPAQSLAAATTHFTAVKAFCSAHILHIQQTMYACGLICSQLTARASFEEFFLPGPLMNALKYKLPNTIAVPSLPVAFLVNVASDGLLVVCMTTQSGHDAVCQNTVE